METTKNSLIGQSFRLFYVLFGVLFLIHCSGSSDNNSSGGTGNNSGTASSALQRFQGLWLEDHDEDGYVSGDQRLLLSFNNTSLTFYSTDPNDINTVLDTFTNSPITVEDYAGQPCDCWLVNYTTDGGTSAAYAFGFISDNQIAYLGEILAGATFTRYEGSFSPPPALVSRP
jgi:hypothetical protein